MAGELELPSAESVGGGAAPRGRAVEPELRRFGAGAPKPAAVHATSATLDYPAERCLPYIFPLKSVADECAHAPAYEYPELPEWVELGRGK